MKASSTVVLFISTAYLAIILFILGVAGCGNTKRPQATVIFEDVYQTNTETTTDTST